MPDIIKAPLIFDIKRAATEDGPGIRTTVFFKGCGLRCAWCHNPESQSVERQKMFFKNKCTNCGTCREVCPNKGEHCTLCGQCAAACSQNAIKLCGEAMSVDTLLNEILKDKLFYEASGGGVTFSGGECMLYPDLLCELLKGCKACGIHTAVDTAGNVFWESFERILPYTDMFLYDVKLATDALHKKYTGVSNRLILQNLNKLSECFKGEIIIRIPIIGGVNDSEEEMHEIAELLKNIRHRRVELLPYHNTGEYKFEALGRKAVAYYTPTENKMKHLREAF